MFDVIEDETHEQNYVKYRIEKLINNGATLSYKNSRGRNAFHNAAVYGYTDVVKVLIKHFPSAINKKAETGLPPVAYSLSSEMVTISRTGIGPMTNLLLLHGANNPFFWAKRASSNDTQLYRVFEWLMNLLLQTESRLLPTSRYGQNNLSLLCFCHT